MEVVKSVLTVMILTLIFFSGCTSNNKEALHENETSKTTQEKKEKIIIGNQTILNEISRLSNLAAKGTVSESDLETLKSMVESNDEAKDELYEIEVLVKYKEYKHANHGLSFLDSYIRTGKHMLCPSHALAHYYVFNRNNESELADEAFKEAKEQLPAWISVAKEYDEKYPAPFRFNEVKEKTENHIKSIEAGEKTATNEEIDFLATNGICVENSEDGHE